MSGFFEVMMVLGAAMAKPVEANKLGILRRVTEQRLQRIKKKEKESIDVASEKMELNLSWLYASRFLARPTKHHTVQHGTSFGDKDDYT